MAGNHVVSRGGRVATLLAALVAAIAMSGAIAAPARADDASVLRAWESIDAAFTVLGR